jgi:hypothetical protein
VPPSVWSSAQLLPLNLLCLMVGLDLTLNTAEALKPNEVAVTSVIVGLELLIFPTALGRPVLPAFSAVRWVSRGEAESLLMAVEHARPAFRTVRNLISALSAPFTVPGRLKGHSGLHTALVITVLSSPEPAPSASKDRLTVCGRLEPLPSASWRPPSLLNLWIALRAVCGLQPRLRVISGRRFAHRRLRARSGSGEG